MAVAFLPTVSKQCDADRCIAVSLGSGTAFEMPALPFCFSTVASTNVPDQSYGHQVECSLAHLVDIQQCARRPLQPGCILPSLRRPRWRPARFLSLSIRYEAFSARLYYLHTCGGVAVLFRLGRFQSSATPSPQLFLSGITTNLRLKWRVQFTSYIPQVVPGVFIQDDPKTDPAEVGAVSSKTQANVSRFNTNSTLDPTKFWSDRPVRKTMAKSHQIHQRAQPRR